MSNGLAIAAATRTLRNLLAAATPNVTMMPLDQARQDNSSDQLNIFLYASLLSGAWRNADPPSTRPGESAQPALPLTLHYLITAYGEDEAAAQAVLGRAMSVLHDHPVLDPQEIQDATSTDLPDSDLHLQPERPRLTPLALTTDDLFKLWSGFSTNYRLSAAYELSLVLIDSNRAARSPLPVLRRGPQDRGPTTVAAPSARLLGVEPPPNAMTAVLGSAVRLLGEGLDSPITAVRFRHPLLAAPIDLIPDAGSRTERTVRIPDGAAARADWTPGRWSVALVDARPGLPAAVGDPVPMPLGPAIAVSPSAVPAGDLTLTITCLPRLRDGARVLALLDERPAAPDSVITPADPVQPSTVTVTFRGIPAGSYVVRLRADGADSDPVRMAGVPPRPEFDPATQVVVT
jgi:Pvc16 N-terminal domain